MKLIVFDSLYRYKTTYKGEYNNGIFTYKEGLFGKPQTFNITINYNDLYDIGGKEKVAFAIFDGKDYKQITFRELPQAEKYSVADYVKEFKIAKLTEEIANEKPQNIDKVILEIIFIIGIGIVSITAYLAASNLYNAAKLQSTTLNKSINSETIALNRLINLTERVYNISIPSTAKLTAP